MKYRNSLTRALLKEFRHFNKWNPKGLYVFRNENPEEEFNKRIAAIINKHKEVRK